MNRFTAFVAGIVVVSSLVTVWHQLAEHTTSTKFTNRAWVDQMPRSQKDVVTWFIPLHLRGKRFGVSQRNSHFWFQGERFTWKGQGKQMELTFQQSDRKVRLEAHAYRCNKQGFDLCLDLRRGDRKATLYSKSRWKIPRQAAELPAIDTTPFEATCTACDDELPSPLAQLFSR